MIDAAAEASVPFEGHLKTGVIDIPVRIRFIERLMLLPAFEGNSILRAIRDDYVRTKKEIDRVEQEHEE